eukprot:CAMPEP_0116961574 /NCGR_PEP_ID=MMETSP0467-20121206/46649_1 /TAXON_ID=283647 /ORGANISM="Mesodinium pulex, Strain SPMC105" /LENGTH=36 /DNA_ID= /DNA_START= /DNA_END= /DNA_ORIENTATION=
MILRPETSRAKPWVSDVGAQKAATASNRARRGGRPK